MSEEVPFGESGPEEAGRITITMANTVLSALTREPAYTAVRVPLAPVPHC